MQRRESGDGELGLGGVLPALLAVAATEGDKLGKVHEAVAVGDWSPSPSPRSSKDASSSAGCWWAGGRGGTNERVAAGGRALGDR